MAKEKKLLQVWLSGFELTLLDSLAKKWGMNRSQLIRYCLTWLTQETEAGSGHQLAAERYEYPS
ncbi:MAG: hypothetical protein KIT46_02575 [Anaerolineales bacterium]|nr:hypothetical protein [Anaerolineales bacterium]MCW5854911.1 hypothetical protein [Anaerolineales bacterium]